MKHKKLILLLLSFSLLTLLCACGQEKEVSPENSGFSVSLEASAGTGFYWICTISDENIIAVESEQIAAESPVPGSPVTTNFYFTGKKQGTTTATFCCQQSWDDSVCYLYTCDLTIDREKAVTGELSRQTAKIRPGDGLYKLKASDTSIALWTEEDDGSYVFTPLRNGSTTLTFTPFDEAEASSRVFYLSVTEAGTFSITEDPGLMSTESYDTLDTLEKKVGFSMGIPEGAEPGEISSVGTLAYASFTWHDMEFAYAGGDLDWNSFLGPDTHIETVSGHRMIIQNSVSTMAAWENNGNVYCVTSEEILTDKDLQTFLAEMLTAQQLPENQRILSQ